MSLPADVDVASIAHVWFGTFADHVQMTDVGGILSQLVDDAFWCDTLAFTWDLHTFYGHNHIRKFLVDHLATTNHCNDHELGGACSRYRLDWGIFHILDGGGDGTGIIRLVSFNFQWRVEGPHDFRRPRRFCMASWSLLVRCGSNTRNSEHGQNSAVWSANVRDPE